MARAVSDYVPTDEVRTEIVSRAVALGISSTPSSPSHKLGEIALADGRIVSAHVVHAVDAVITDGKHIVVINRKNPPGKGLPALPGGFMDARNGGIESAVQAAAREALEEAGIKLGVGILIGARNMTRPHDVRTATSDLPDYGIKEGDIFMVSTQAVRFDVADLKKTSLLAGDDAEPGSARLALIQELTRDSMGIADHYDMIIAATTDIVQNALRHDVKAYAKASQQPTRSTIMNNGTIKAEDIDFPSFRT